MLVDYEYKNGKLLVSYTDENGDIKIKHYDWRNPHKFIITDEYDPKAHSVYRSWDNKKVKLVPTKNPNRYAIYEFLDALDPVEKNEIFRYKEPNIYFCDIETEIIDSGFVEPKDASTKILSIALVHKHKTRILGIKPLHQNEKYFIQDETNRRLEKFGVKYNVEYLDFSQYENPEKEMMITFSKMVQKMPVITGWNFVNYDWTFIVNRMRRLGLDPTVMSPTRLLTQPRNFGDPTATYRGNNYGDDNAELPYHRIVVDYMELFKKWDTSIKIRESYSLDFVAEKTLGGEGKVHYTGGLQSLYEQDYKMYLFYNLIDTILVQMIHEKMKYINVMYAIAALSKTRALDAFSALRVTEGLLRGDFREKKHIVLCKDYEDSTGDEKVEGGFVRDPNRGLNKWVACYDFASLYPTTQRQNNIAPENFKGEKENANLADFNGRRIAIDANDIICINGAVFNRDFSVTCNKLTEIYNDRKKYKKQMLKAKDELKKLQNELLELTVSKSNLL